MPRITLIDKADRFTYKPLLYDVVTKTASEDEVAPPFSQLLAPYPITFIQAQVSSVSSDPHSKATVEGQGGKVALQGGETVDYDWLVVALGAQVDSRGVPGVKELALALNSYEDALKVQSALDQITQVTSPSFSPGSERVVSIIGAGYAGVELAAVVAERLGGLNGQVKTELVTPNLDIMDGCPPGQVASAKRVLSSLGVRVVTGTKVTRISPRASSLTPTGCEMKLQAADSSPPRSQPSDLVLWTAGSSPVTREARAGFPFPTNTRGSVQTEPSLRVLGDARVFALGDVSLTEGSEPLPATAQVALQQADYVAWNLWASINGRTLLPFRYQHLGNMMSLGQLNAAVAVPFSVPIPLKDSVNASPLGPLLSSVGIKLGDGGEEAGGVTVEGPLAVLVRRAAYLYRQPTTEQRINVAQEWIQAALKTIPRSK